ncbi:ABC transporter substrate-binding protein [Amycolatopsis silviterrae]|uniref:ABC transporter substrate-binding protein n=1 Tax=Amycolatopsis silviterrae TaxID=1656914 RepID=A0ABW5HBX4_9PSEU
MNCPLWKKLLLLAATALVTVSSACGVAESSNSVGVIGVWTEGEEAAFNQVKRRFEEKTGIKVRYQGTRAVEQVLAADVQQGAAPDIAVLSSPGLLADYARRHEIKPLDFLEKKAESFYGRQWVNLQRLGTGKLYSVAVKADLKSAIWYRPSSVPGPKPTTWQQLVALAAGPGTPWCLGLASPPTSGFPGTDWIEDILLHSAGPEIYRQWAGGTLPWTSDPVRQAFRDWGTLVVRPGGIQGGAPAALLTDFRDSARPLFTDPPGCRMEHQGSFAMGSYQNMHLRTPTGPHPQPGTDYDFFPFPGSGASEVSADLAAMFADTPQARQFLDFLVSPEAQQIWAGNPNASAFSAGAAVAKDVYPDPVKRKVADTLTAGKPVCFDASDLMPATMTGAFYRAILEYTADPTQLDTLLNRLDDTRKGIPREEWLNVPCGQ